MELTRETTTDLNISTEVEVLSYANNGQAREVLARVQLGTSGQPITGNGSYTIRIYINGVLNIPDSPISIPSGVTKAIANSRIVVVDADEIVSVRVLGLGGDTAVTVTTILRDATAITPSEVTGDGDVEVDHNYGGADALSYKTSGNVAIVGADIRIFTAADYTAGNRANQYIVARSNTTAGGRWSRPVLLAPGNYTLLYYKQGPNGYGPDTINVTVS